MSDIRNKKLNISRGNEILLEWAGDDYINKPNRITSKYIESIQNSDGVYFVTYSYTSRSDYWQSTTHFSKHTVWDVVDGQAKLNKRFTHKS